ncbi:50S ribosomal protein L13 [Populus alba x Populus x berolinensis]|nr:50S ribosomal protein L13 [Populus alba x Populus x berolinensis]
MAMLCASSSFTTSTKPSSSYSTKNGTSISPSPFVVGFSFSQSRFSLSNSRRGFEVRCEKKDKSVVTRVPLDQRWLFEESEINGPDIWNTTWYPKAADHINTEKTWYIVDATDKILGRLASTIAIYIRGKNLATYTPSVDMGAFVIVVSSVLLVWFRTSYSFLSIAFLHHITYVSKIFIDKIINCLMCLVRVTDVVWMKKRVVNAEKVAVSGKKRTQKLYRRHSGRPGGMTVETFDQLQQRIPERIIEHAVRGMLPKGRLGRALFNHLKVYTGPTHPHEAQKPIELPIRDKRIQMER